MTRFQFVADHRHAFEVKRLCQTVEVFRSSFYAWVKSADVVYRGRSHRVICAGWVRR